MLHGPDRAEVATSVAVPLLRRLLGVLWIASLATVVLLALAANLGPKVGLFYTASDDARYVTGNTVFVDGGTHINGAAWAPDLGD